MNTYVNVEIAAMLGVNRTALSAWLRVHESEIADAEQHITLRGKRKAYDEFAVREICRLRKVDVPAALSEKTTEISAEIIDVKQTTPLTEVATTETTEPLTKDTPDEQEAVIELSPEERIAQLEAENAALKEYLTRYINDFTNQAEAITEILSENGKVKVKKLKKKYAKLLEMKKNEV